MLSECTDINKIILPYQSSLTKAWPEHNFLLSIIQNKPTAYDWIMNTYVQTYSCHYIGYGYNDRRVSFYPFAQFSSKAGFYDLCPFLNKYSLPNTIIQNHYNSFTDLIQEVIKRHYYVSTYLDQYHIRNDVSNPGFIHPGYIYGFDFPNQLVYLFDNFEHGFYTSKKISFEILNDSYALSQKIYNQKYDAGTFLYELIDFNYIFDLNLMINLLKDYLNPEKSMCYLYSLSYYKDKNATSITNRGINCYELIFDILNDILENKNININEAVRSFAFYVDHKKLMKLRYEYLANKGYLPHETNLSMEFNELEKNCSIVQNLYLKYIIKRNKNMIEKIKKMLENIKENDKNTIEYVIEKLEK